MRITSVPGKAKRMTPAKRRSNRKRRDWSRPVRTAFVIILVVGVSVACFTSPSLRVKRVRVEGLQTLTPDHVLQEARVPKRTNIFWMALRQPFAKRLAADPVIDHATRAISLPHTLVLRVSERQPYALLHVDSQYYVMDRKGVPFRVMDKPMPGLRILEWAGTESPLDLKIGSPIQAAWLDDAYQLLALLADKKNLAVTSIKVDQNANLCLNRLDNLQIRLGQADALPQKIALAQATVAVNGGELASHAEYIDVSCPEQPVWMPRSLNSGKEGSNGTVSDAARQPDDTNKPRTTPVRIDPASESAPRTKSRPGE